MNPWQKASDGRERKRASLREYDLVFSGWAYRQTEAEAQEEMTWFVYDNKLIDSSYVDDDCLEEGHDD